MSGLVELLGNTLMTKSGPVQTKQVLAGKTTIALYYCAAWAGRSFTATLEQVYKKLAESGEKGFEVVCVSKDFDETAFETVFDSMSWFAVPYGSEVRTELIKKWNVRGAPSLIVVDREGNLVNRDARKIVSWLGAQGFPFSVDRVQELAEAALKELTSQQLQTVFDSGAKVVCLLLGSTNEARARRLKLPECIPEVVGKEPGPFAAYYIPWEDKENVEGHASCAMGMSQITGTDQIVQAIERLYDGPIECPTPLVLKRGEDGQWSVVTTCAFDGIRFHRARAYPWSAESIARCQEEEAAHAEVMKSKYRGLELLKFKDVATLQHGVGAARAERGIDEIAASHEIVGFYFATVDCEVFTRRLSDMYYELRGRGHKFEVVVVTSDLEDDAAFEEVYGPMPWLALPLKEKELNVVLHSISSTSRKSLPFEEQAGAQKRARQSGSLLDVNTRAAVLEYGAAAWPFSETSMEAARQEAARRAEAAEAEGYSQQEAASGAGLVLRRKTGPVNAVRVDAATRTVAMQAHFLTAAAEGLVVPEGEKAYWEFEVTKYETKPLHLLPMAQIGWATVGWEARQGQGVGDDDASWAVDGIRQLRWHKAEARPFNRKEEFAHGRRWEVGDVIGISVDLSGPGIVASSHNGSFEAPDGPAFSELSGVERGVFPVLTLSKGMEVAVNFGEKPFKFAPPASFKPAAAFA